MVAKTRKTNTPKTQSPFTRRRKNQPRITTAAYSKLALVASVSLLTLLVLDGLWINFVSKALGYDYFDAVKSIQGGAEMAKRPLGLLAYLSMAAACSRASERGGAAAAGETGFYIYSIYDSTNTFLFKGWSPALALMDIVWGTSVFAVAGAAATAAVAAAF